MICHMIDPSDSCAWQMFLPLSVFSFGFISICFWLYECFSVRWWFKLYLNLITNLKRFIHTWCYFEREIKCLSKTILVCFDISLFISVFTCTKFWSCIYLFLNVRKHLIFIYASIVDEQYIYRCRFKKDKCNLSF